MKLFEKSKNNTKGKDEAALVKALFGEIDMNTLFPEAFLCLQKKETDRAINILQQQTASKESRIIIAAWSELRKLGINPPQEITKQLLGFVIEVEMPKGRDILAVYPDHRARYFNYSGAKIFWEHEATEINLQIDALVKEAQQVVYHIGVWEQERRTTLGKGMARLSFLTPAGLHFGEGSFNALYKDKLAHNCIVEATKLMQMLTIYKE